MSENGWKELTELWQGDEELDLQDLPQKTRRATRQMRVAIGFEIFCSFLIFVGGAWILWNSENIFDVAFGTFAILGSSFLTYFLWWLRKGTWQAASENLVDQLKLARRRALSEIRCLNSTPAVAIAGALFPAIRIVQHWNKLIEAEPARHLYVFTVLVIYVLFLVGFAIWGVWFKRRKQLEVKRIERILSEIKDD